MLFNVAIRKVCNSDTRNTGDGSLCPSKSLSNDRLYLYYKVFPMFCQELKNSAPDRAALTSPILEEFCFPNLS